MWQGWVFCLCICIHVHDIKPNLFFLYFLKVGDPEKCTQVSNDLMRHYNIYVQSINYPTVARGEERLRIAPTPHHTDEMMDGFVTSLVNIWKENRLPFVWPVCSNACECQAHCTTAKQQGLISEHYALPLAVSAWFSTRAGSISWWDSFLNCSRL